MMIYNKDSGDNNDNNYSSINKSLINTIIVTPTIELSSVCDM